MKDTKEVVLFFNNNANYEAIDIAKELKNRYPELGNPIIIPAQKDSTKPVIAFKENPDFTMHASLTSISFVVNHTYFKKLASICFDLVDIFGEININLVRIGYISSVFLSSDKIDVVKNKFLRIEEFDDVSDINLAWYREIETDFGNLNSWERIVTDHLDFPDLLCQYDFNTPVDKNINIDMKYLKKFFNFSNEYIEKRIDL